MKPTERKKGFEAPTGIEGLDSVLVTGSPGTDKTTLGGAFSVAAGQRGERTLFVSFDSKPKE